MTKDEALRLALEYLVKGYRHEMHKAVIKTIKEALAQPEPEPVAWKHRKPVVDACGNAVGYTDWMNGPSAAWWPHRSLYDHPKEWQYLTLEEIWDSTHGLTRIQKDNWVATDEDLCEFAHIIEAKLRSKNT